MPLFFALATLVAGHALGWPALSGWWTNALSLTEAGQGIMHGLLMAGLAGAALSWSKRPRFGLPLLFLGTLAVVGLMTEDVMGIIERGPAWQKDLLDLGQRAGLIGFFLIRATWILKTRLED